MTIEVPVAIKRTTWRQISQWPPFCILDTIQSAQGWRWRSFQEWKVRWGNKEANWAPQNHGKSACWGYIAIKQPTSIVTNDPVEQIITPLNGTKCTYYVFNRHWFDYQYKKDIYLLSVWLASRKNYSDYLASDDNTVLLNKCKQCLASRIQNMGKIPPPPSHSCCSFFLFILCLYLKTTYVNIIDKIYADHNNRASLT